MFKTAKNNRQQLRFGVNEIKLKGAKLKEIREEKFSLGLEKFLFSCRDFHFHFTSFILYYSSLSFLLLDFFQLNA